MAFSIADLFKASLLVLNALAILSERRLLQPLGLSGEAQANAFDSQQQSPAKAQVSQVLASVRTLLRWPLIILNAITIAFALVFG
jgi:hypothetical protein